MNFLVGMTALSLVVLLPSTHSQPYTDASIKDFTDEANTIAELSQLYKLDGKNSPSSLGGRTLFEGIQMVEELLKAVLAVDGDGFHVQCYVGCGGKGLNTRAAIYDVAKKDEIKTRNIQFDITEIPNYDGSHGKDSYFNEIDVQDKKKIQERKDCNKVIDVMNSKLENLPNVTYSYLLDTAFSAKLRLQKDSLSGSTFTELEKAKNWYLIQENLSDRFKKLLKLETKLVIEGAFGDGFEGDRPAPVPYALTKHLNNISVPAYHLDNVLGVSQAGSLTKTWTLYNRDGGRITADLVIVNQRNVIQLYPRTSTVIANETLNANIIQCGLNSFLDAIRNVAVDKAEGLIRKLKG